jgi:GTP-binding protein
MSKNFDDDKLTADTSTDFSTKDSNSEGKRNKSNANTFDPDPFTYIETQYIRNVAIIAHVDHGKTTLVDSIYRQSILGKKSEMERMMDRNIQEQERGITISGKCASFFWKRNGKVYKINISDTPGHKAFRGQVELLNCGIEGAVVVVDAREGIKPGTREVLLIAQGYGVRPILCINKVDRIDPVTREGQVNFVRDNVLSLFAEGNVEDLEAPVVYGSGREGSLSLNLDGCLDQGNIDDLFNTIVDYIQPPAITHEGSPRILVTMMDFNKYLGNLIIGYVRSSPLTQGLSLTSVDSEGRIIETFKINKLFTMRGTEYVEANYVNVGDIAVISGSSKTYVTHTVGLTTPQTKIVPLPAPKIETPSLCVTFHSLPDAIKDKAKPSSISDIKTFLFQESYKNPGITVKETGNGIEVYGREELQIEVISETMRREERLEFMLGKPIILTKNEGGKILEAYDKIEIDTPDKHVNDVLSEMNYRRAEMLDMVTSDDGSSAHIVYLIPSKNAIGLSGKLSTLSSGAIIIDSTFSKWGPQVDDVNARMCGVLLASSAGVATPYALDARKDKGRYFIAPSDQIYENQIVGMSSTDRTERLNVCETKKLTNVRAAGSDEAVVPPVKDPLSVAKGLSLIEDNVKGKDMFKEYVVVKPGSIFLMRFNK